MIIDVIADIPKLPSATLTASKWALVEEILDYRVGTIWRDFLSGTLEGYAEVYTSGLILTELVGSEESMQKWVNNELN